MKALEKLQQVAQVCANLEQFTAQAVNIICDELNFSFVGIIFVDMLEKSAKPYMGTAGFPTYNQRFPYPLDKDNLISYSIRTGQPCTYDMTQVEWRHPLFPQACVNIVLPMKTVSNVIGAVEIFSPTYEDLKEQVIYLLEPLANYIAITYAKLIEKDNFNTSNFK